MSPLIPSDEKPYDLDAIIAALRAEQLDLNAARATLRRRVAPRGEAATKIKITPELLAEVKKQFGDLYLKIPLPRRRGT
jgi:hypothetical protein